MAIELAESLVWRALRLDVNYVSEIVYYLRHEILAVVREKKRLLPCATVQAL
jgi:hypothetical protein